ncbi:MAG: hypothetical protein EAZ89_05590 [Bacteroidetes bacterium]|nr:MAG: hypothetical protein EAZ89_05590 [Bacteroidota bacterium]
MLRSALSALVLCLLLLSCGKKRDIHPSFYHWKSEFALTKGETDYLKQLSVKRLYVRLFDVAWEGNAATPRASLRADSSAWQTWEVVPVVYITNEVMLRVDADEVPMLAQKISTRMQRLLGGRQVPEIQIDCDWSEQSRASYFRLLEEIRKAWPGPTLSATIRLHQVKYAGSTGVPPVDRGMLMFYNMGDLRDPETQNSIFDPETAKPYLGGIKTYPLPLDVALPAFSWVVIVRQGRPIDLISPAPVQELRDTSRFQAFTDQRFRVDSGTFLNGVYLYGGDELRIEQVDYSLLQEAASLVAPLIRNPDIHLVYYHLTPQTAEQYPYESLEAITRMFD